AGVGRVANEVADAREHAVGAQRRDQPRAQRLGGPTGEAVGDAVRGRRRVGGGDAPDVGLEQLLHAIDMPGATGASTSSGAEDAPTTQTTGRPGCASWTPMAADSPKPSPPPAEK